MSFGEGNLHEKLDKLADTNGYLCAEVDGVLGSMTAKAVQVLHQCRGVVLMAPGSTER